MKGRMDVSRLWLLYRMGGLPPALASMFGMQDAQQMAFIRSMAKSQRKESLLHKPLQELETVVFDLETTGFNPASGDEILSFGAVAMRGAEILHGQTFYRLVKPKRGIPPQIVLLTGISNEMAAEGKDLIDSLHDFMAFVGTRPLVAHASAHDKSFLNSALRRTSKIGLNHRVLDTMHIARALEPGRDSYSLDELLAAHKIEISIRHHALEDARMTAGLWQHYLGTIIARNLVTLGDLYTFLSKR
ncbi:exonuclease domain-containing protein [Paenibacillus sp. GCM10027626]|uniref:exonuclease domain-containing protein n=1 Tax=Paenibacillus sp. GCM10027626 TaxID=3273411 RepID=UPI003634B50B